MPQKEKDKKKNKTTHLRITHNINGPASLQQKKKLYYNILVADDEGSLLNPLHFHRYASIRSVCIVLVMHHTSHQLFLNIFLAIVRRGYVPGAP